MSHISLALLSGGQRCLRLEKEGATTTGHVPGVLWDRVVAECYSVLGPCSAVPRELGLSGQHDSLRFWEGLRALRLRSQVLEPCRGPEPPGEVAVGALPGPCGAHREVLQGADSCSSSHWLPGWPHAEPLTCNAQYILRATHVPDAAELRQAGDLAMTTGCATWSRGPLVLCWGPECPWR